MNKSLELHYRKTLILMLLKLSLVMPLLDTKRRVANGKRFFYSVKHTKKP